MSTVTELHTEVLRVLTSTAAACRYGDTDDWFPAEPELGQARVVYEELARRRCAGCPVRRECLELALRYEARPMIQPYGIWGGTAPWQREAILRSRRRLARRVAGRDRAAVAS
jgi:WhiB family redox-sensing transcriptional regulator